MSKDIQPQPQQSEEVDLGQLFKLIGNGFTRFFNFIGDVFKGLFTVVISLLQHFLKRFVWYAAAVIIGLVVGVIMDKNVEKQYGANMFIETNFNSVRQVYENMKEFHQLANVDRDSVELAKRLDITPSQAAKLRGFYIEPDLDENTMVEMYSELYSKLDSVSRLEMNYEKYKKSLAPKNFKNHKIGVASIDKFLYKEIEKAFVEQLQNNDYLQELLVVNTENLERQNKTLQVQVQKTDSLVNEYLKIRLNESKKEPIAGAGTNLYMGNAESSGLIMDESKIIDKRLNLEEQRREVYQNMVEQKAVVNVLAGFPNSGYSMDRWYENIKFQLPIVLMLLTLGVFTVLGLVKFLRAQEKK